MLSASRLRDLTPAFFQRRDLSESSDG